jgi:Ser/Thr protein kinase RdoA (MazF antagonist)
MPEWQPDMNPPVFASLTPAFILDALAALGLMPDGRLMALNSFENRVYLAQLEPGTPLAAEHPALVLKFYRPGRWSAEQIEEEHAFAQELMAAEVPVVGPLAIGGRTLHQHEGMAFSVSPRRGGRAPELDDEDTLAWIGRFLARLHTVGERAAFRHRPAVDLASYGTEPRAWLLAHAGLPLEVEREWAEVSQHALDAVADALAALDAPGGDDAATSIRRLRLHADCHVGNILWTPAELPGGGPHFVDLDDCRSGPAVQDLWMLQSGTRAERQRQLGALLDGYEQMREFDRRELALIEPLRTLRLIHYSAWIARRWDDPAFPAAFPGFGTPDYWRGQIATLREQLEAMAEPPLVA